MALDSQSTLVQGGSDLTGKSLAKNLFAEGIKWHVRAESVTAQAFQKANYRADYTLQGSYLEGAAQLSYRRTSMATDRKLPNHLEKDIVRWKTTPVRRYDRIARDPLAWARASGPGAFQDMSEYEFDLLWEGWGRMEIQHAIGDSRGYLALVSSRTDNNTVVVKDGYGHTGTDPLLHLEEGMTIAWLDASNSYAVGGAGKVDSITRSSNTVNLAAAWDDGTTVPAAGDPIVIATTTSTSDDHFKTEYNLAPHGLMGIIDPDENNTTHLNISESTYFRWKPFREASATFDHWEVQEHFRKIAAHGAFGSVGPQTHLALCNPTLTSELARTLGGYQQQANLGRVLEGGYQSVRIGNMDFAEDQFLPHDVLFTVCLEDLFRADLEGDADFYEEDGSMWSRLKDEDADEAFVKEYMQTWSDRRNRHGCLTGITLSNVSATDFSPSTR